VGHGAPKRIDAIPTELIVKVFTWEGLLYESQRKLSEVLKAILDGDDSPSMWIALDNRRKEAVFYSQQYTKAILAFQFSQNRA
jgi:hypothetical protein